MPLLRAGGVQIIGYFPSLPQSPSFITSSPLSPPLSDTIYLFLLVSVSRLSRSRRRCSQRRRRCECSSYGAQAHIPSPKRTVPPPARCTSSARLTGAHHRPRVPPLSPLTPPPCLNWRRCLAATRHWGGRAMKTPRIIVKKLLSLQVPGRVHTKPGRQFYGQKILHF